MVIKSGAQTKILFFAKAYLNYMRIDQFLLDLYPKQILRPTDRQILNSRMAMKLAIVPKWKGNCPTDRKSHTDYCLIFSSSTITWEIRKESTVVLSSTETEYMTLFDATNEGIYLNQLLNEIWGETIEKVLTLRDNKKSIKIAENPVFHEWTKHIELDIILSDKVFKMYKLMLIVCLQRK